MVPPLTCGPGAPQRRLLQAAVTGDLQLFKRTASVLDAGKGRLRESVESVKDRGAGALHFAAGSGRTAVCAYLVEELHVDVNNADESGDTPLVHAIRGGAVDTLQYLLDHDTNPDKPDEKGSTPLHKAAAGGNCEIVKALLSKGANVDSMSDGGTPLHMAAFCKQDDVMKILLDHHADCNKVFKTVYTPLFVALSAGSLKCVKLLIQAGASVKGVGTATPLIVAANNGLTDFYKCLLEAGADPDVRDDDDPVYRMNPADIKLEGSKAYKKNDYFTAIKLYSMAANHCPDDATLYSNRSLCWLKMGEGDRALMDAQLCRMNRPDWAKACYLQGAAQMLLKDYEKACDAFLDGLKLDPASVEIYNALWEAVDCLKKSHATKKLSELSFA